MTTSVFITALWKDYRLAWNPKDYNGLKESRIPGYHQLVLMSPSGQIIFSFLVSIIFKSRYLAHTVWRPDIVLYNNDDGNYDPTVKTNVIIKSNGVCEWMPPAIYKKGFHRKKSLQS